MRYGKHPYHESAIEREREKANEELQAYLVKAESVRQKLAGSRILEAMPVEPVTVH